MKRITLAILLSVLGAMCGACKHAAPASDSSNENSNSATTGLTSIESSPGTAQRSSKDAVTAAPDSVMHLKVGSSGEAGVKITVQSGFHTNANPASAPNLIPTQLTVDPVNGIVAGKPVYPAPSGTRKFQFSETPLKVYEGTVLFKVPIKTAASLPKGELSLKATVRAQPCDEEVCYPPRNIEVTIPVVID